MRKAIAILMLVLLLLATAIGIYYNFVYLPEKRLEERIEPLIDAGLTREEALKFDEEHRNWTINNRYNQSVVSYALGLKKHPSVFRKLLNFTGSVDETVFGDLDEDGINNYNEIFIHKTDPFTENIPPAIHTIEYIQEIFMKEPQLIKVNASDNKAMDKVFIEVTRPDNVTESFPTELIDDLFTLNFTNTSQLGPYKIRASAFDKSGNVVYRTEFFTVNFPPPPYIKNLTCEPIKVVNDKVYDERISFTAESDYSQITEVYLRRIPRIYPQFPSEAFPDEAEEGFVLLPLDGKFDEKREEFAKNITDIPGGREYDYIVTVIDKVGNNATASLTTPYIREFERKPSDYLLGASYMTFWDIYCEGTPAGRWKEVGTVYEPVLGQYNSRDQIVISKHIDWATEHGITFFYLDFGWIRPNSPFDRVARECLLTSDLADSINFTVFYFSDPVVGESWSQGPTALYSDFSFLATHYFTHPSYLKVDNKLVVYTLNLPHYWREFGVKETNNLFKDLKVYIKNKYGHELFLVADVWPPDADDSSFLDDPNFPFDGILNWGNLWYNIGGNELKYNDYADKYAEQWKKWYSLADRRGLQFIPLILPGFDDKPYADHYGRVHHCIKRNPERFRQLCHVTKEYTTPIKMIMLFTWNDFHEGTSIEPTREYGFTYLDIIEEEFCEG